jgi:hypothetical protein
MKRQWINRGMALLLILLMVFWSVGCTTSSQESDGKGNNPPVEEPAGSGNQEEPVQDGDTPVSNDGSTGGNANDGINPDGGSGSGGSGGGSEPSSGGSRGLTSPETAEQVTISITAATILDNLDNFDSAKKSLLPKDGVLVSTRSVPFKEGNTVFDALLAVTKDQRVHMEYVSTPLYKSNYIEGIANIYEMDAGPLSGWMYKVNGVFPSVGCGRYGLKAGDVIEWVYTCDLGRDVGGNWNEQNSDR